MADDLDDFLKQAALRRQQRQQQRTNSPPVVKPVPEPTRSAPPPRLQQQDPIPNAKVVDYSKPYAATVGNLSSSLPSTSLEGGVDQADERMQSHLRQVFQHEIGSLRPSEPKSPPRKKAKKEQHFKRPQQHSPKCNPQPKFRQHP